MQTVHVGIDPGNTGALVVLEDGEVEFHDTPTYRDGKKTRIDAAGCAALLRDLKYDCLPDSGKRLMVTIERVGARPNEGVSSMFTFGHGYGIWIGALAALEIPYQLVTPQAWKKVMMPGAPHDKDASRIVARRLFPTQTEEGLSRKKDHGRADALLMAEYGRRTAG